MYSKKKEKGSMELIFILPIFFLFTCLMIAFFNINVQIKKEAIQDNIEISNFASTLLDMEYTGSEKQFRIINSTDLSPQALQSYGSLTPYEQYMISLKGNMKLDEPFVQTETRSAMNAYMSSGVEIKAYIFYNVDAEHNKVYEFDFVNNPLDEYGYPTPKIGEYGIMAAPDGTIIEETSVWSEVAYETPSFFGFDHEVHVGELTKVSELAEISNGTNVMHRYENVTYEWNWTGDNYTCTASAYCLCHDEFESEEVNAISKIYQAATCTINGKRIYYAYFSNGFFTNKNTNDYPPSGDDHLTIPAYGHKFEERNTDPTCTKKGLRYEVCLRCQGTVILEEKAALGHDFEETIVEVTCTENGYTKKTCSRCNGYIVTDYIYALGHRYTENTVPVTCTADGYIEKICSVCNHQEKTNIVKATGHSLKDAKYTWSDDRSNCTGLIECRNCDYNITQTVLSTSNLPAKISCETSGSFKYTADFTDPNFTDQEYLYVLNAKGHSYSEPKYTWNSTRTSCLAESVCNSCGNKISESASISKTHKDQTCTEEGVDTYVATFANNRFKQQLIRNSIPAYGHNYGTAVYDYDLSTSKCDAYNICKRCNYKYSLFKIFELKTIKTPSYTSSNGVVTSSVNGSMKATATFDDPVIPDFTVNIISTVTPVFHQHDDDCAIKCNLTMKAVLIDDTITTDSSRRYKVLEYCPNGHTNVTYYSTSSTANQYVSNTNNKKKCTVQLGNAATYCDNNIVLKEIYKYYDTSVSEANLYHTYNKTINGHVHKYNVVNTKTATCSVTGTYNFKCNGCGDVISKTGLSLPHTSTPGKTASVHTKCILCGTTLSTTHTYTSNVKIAATCTTKGTTTYTCKCGYQYDAQDINLADHVYKITDHVHQGNTTEGGECYVAIPHVHNYANSQATYNANPSAYCGYNVAAHYEGGCNGTMSYHCGGSYDSNGNWYYFGSAWCSVGGSAHGWQRNGSLAEALAWSGCSSYGQTRTTNDRCGNGATYVPASSATYCQKTIDGYKLSCNKKSPTCTETGYVSNVCINCGYSYSSYANALGHKEITDPEFRNHTICERCGIVLKTTHTYADSEAIYNANPNAYCGYKTTTTTKCTGVGGPVMCLDPNGNWIDRRWSNHQNWGDYTYNHPENSFCTSCGAQAYEGQICERTITINSNKTICTYPYKVYNLSDTYDQLQINVTGKGNNYFAIGDSIEFNQSVTVGNYTFTSQSNLQSQYPGSYIDGYYPNFFFSEGILPITNGQKKVFTLYKDATKYQASFHNDKSGYHAIAHLPSGNINGLCNGEFPITVHVKIR